MKNFFKLSQESGKEREEREKNQLPMPSNAPTIMGTRLFYLLCYNDQNNIWLLCHGCNITKGKQDTLTWFKEHTRFGPSFLNAVTEAGGLHAGLLIDKIYQESHDDYLLRIDGEDIRIPGESNKVRGIGEFVRSWYHQHYQSEYDTNKVLYEGIDELTKNELEAIRELRIQCQDKEGDAKQKYLTDVLNEATGVYKSTLAEQSIASQSESGSPDSSTSDNVRADYEAKAIKSAKTRWHNRYCEMKIRRWIKNAYPNSPSSSNVSTSTTGSTRNIFAGKLFHDAGDIAHLKSEQVDTLLERVKSLLIISESPPSREEFRKIFLDLSMSPTDKAIQEAKVAKQETEAERRLRIQSQQETEVERDLRIKETQEKEAERQQKEAERQLRIQSQQEIARLRQLLGQGVGGTTHSAPSSQTAQSTPTSSTAFWQTAPTERTKKRGFDATDTHQFEAEAQPVEQPTKKRATLDPSSPTPSSPDDADTTTTTDQQPTAARGFS